MGAYRYCQWTTVGTRGSEALETWCGIHLMHKMVAVADIEHSMELRTAILLVNIYGSQEVRHSREDSLSIHLVGPSRYEDVGRWAVGGVGARQNWGGRWGDFNAPSPSFVEAPLPVRYNTSLEVCEHKTVHFICYAGERRDPWPSWGDSSRLLTSLQLHQINKMQNVFLLKGTA